MVDVPGAVEGLSAIAPLGSNEVLTISWSVPTESGGVISSYYVIVTNYSFDPVRSMSIPGDKTSTNVTGLGRPTPKLTNLAN